MKIVLCILVAVSNAIACRGEELSVAISNKVDIVCFGDSITHRTYPEQLSAILGVTTFNAGVPGNSSAAGLKRMAKDVFSHQPDVVIILFGTNDGRVDAPKVFVPVDRYADNLNLMVDECEKHRARAVICTLPPVNETAYFQKHSKEPYDAAGGLKKNWSDYRSAAMKVARTRQLPLVDLNHELENEPAWLGPDGVHPTVAGDKIIAYLIAEKITPLMINKSHPAPFVKNL